jgi:hypothetical protein
MVITRGNKKMTINNNSGEQKYQDDHLYQDHHQKYNYMCNECGEAFRSLQEYIIHHNQYHPKSIGTATT